MWFSGETRTKTKTKLEKKTIKKRQIFFFLVVNSNECFRMFLVSFDDGFEQPNQTKHTYFYICSKCCCCCWSRWRISLVCCSILVFLFVCCEWTIVLHFDDNIMCLISFFFGFSFVLRCVFWLLCVRFRYI